MGRPKKNRGRPENLKSWRGPKVNQKSGEGETSPIEEIVDDRQLKVDSQTLGLDRTEQPMKPVESMPTNDDDSIETDERQFQFSYKENPMQLVQSANDTPDDTDSDDEQWEEAMEPDEDDVPTFECPVFTYGTHKFIIVEEYDPLCHQKLFQPFGIPWVRTEILENSWNGTHRLTHSDITDTSVSFTCTGDHYNAAKQLDRSSKQFDIEEIQQRMAQNKKPYNYTGCPSILQYREEGHSLLCSSSFWIPLWATHRQIANNIELRIRQLVDCVWARKGATVKRHFAEYDYLFRRALINTWPKWAQKNQNKMYMSFP